MDIFSKIENAEKESKKTDLFKYIGDGLYVCEKLPKVQNYDLSRYSYIPKGPSCEDTGKQAEKNAKLFEKLLREHNMAYSPRSDKIMKKIEALLEKGVNFKLLSEDAENFLVTNYAYRLRIFYEHGYDIEDAWKRGVFVGRGYLNLPLCNYISDLSILDPSGVPAVMRTDDLVYVIRERGDLNISRETTKRILDILLHSDYYNFMSAVATLFENGQIALTTSEITEIINQRETTIPEIFREFCREYGISKAGSKSHHYGKDNSEAKQQIDKLFDDVQMTV